MKSAAYCPRFEMTDATKKKKTKKKENVVVRLEMVSLPDENNCNLQ
jgi:hypothetical protein